jgi:hypothetical protein
MMALRGWCTSPLFTANPPFQSRQAQLESGVRGNVPAPFGAGERLQSPTYRYLGGSNPARLPGTGMGNLPVYSTSITAGKRSLLCTDFAYSLRKFKAKLPYVVRRHIPPESVKYTFSGGYAKLAC